MGGQKMAKSARNIRRVTDLAEQGIDPLAYRLLCFGTRYRSEMDFSWDAMEAAQRALIRIRQRVADWVTAPRDGFTTEAKELDNRFRDAVSDDLDMPTAVKILNKAVSADLPDGDKYALVVSWDEVLGLDLEREAREGFEVPSDVQALLEERDAAREAREFDRADEIRGRLAKMGWEVMDLPGGTTVRPLRRS